jgi:hypothetical protein
LQSSFGSPSSHFQRHFFARVLCLPLLSWTWRFCLSIPIVEEACLFNAVARPLPAGPSFFIYPYSTSEGTMVGTQACSSLRQ